ncbi:putative tail spike protein [Serratia phage BUCT660]|nr:putative tail spike protein [Serratia phage BUCT660]
MSNNGISISKLPELMDLNDTDFLSVVDTSNLLTNKISVQTLRDLLNYKGAFSSASEGIAKTKSGQIFYVYKPEENGEIFKVSPFVRAGAGAVEIKDELGNEIFHYITDKTLASIISKVDDLKSQGLKGETQGDFGKSKSITEWKGERGQFDVWPTGTQPITGSGISFGGDEYRSFIMVNGQGGLVTQLRNSRVPLTPITHHPYVSDSGRAGADGKMTRIMKIPGSGKSDINNEFEIEFSTNTGLKPTVVIRHPLLFTSAPDWNSRAIIVPDEKNFKQGSSLYYQKIQSEATSGTIVPGTDYRVKMGRSPTGTTLHIYIRSLQGNFICSMINSGMNFYISYKVKGDSNFGLYKIVNKAEYYLNGDGANMTHLMIENYLTDPDGKAADITRTPGTASTDPACGFDTFVLIGLPKTVTMQPGTQLTDPFNNFTLNLTEAFTLTKAIKDSIKAPNQYIDKTVVTGVNFDAKTTTTETVKVANPGYVFDFTYNRNFRYTTAAATNSTIMSAIVPFETWDIVHLNFINPESMGYSKDV